MTAGNRHFCGIVGVVALLGALTDRSAKDTVAFVDVTVVPMDSESILEKQTVIVIGDRIAAVGPSDSVSIPADARRIDGQGRFLMPGLADLHVHLFESRDLPLYLANGVTTIRNLGGGGSADSILALRAAIRRGELAGPSIVTSGNWLDGDPPYREINTVIRTPAEARRIVREQAAAGYDFVKVYQNLSPAVYDAIVDAAREEKIPVTGHIATAVGLDGVLEGRQAAIDHVAQILSSAMGGPPESSRMAERIEDAGVAVTTTLVMLERVSFLRGGGDRVEALLARPEARFLSPETHAFWRRNPFASLPPMPADRLAAAYWLTEVLHRAGVLLLLGTDAGLWGNPPGFSVHDELAHLVAAGLTPYEALRTGTTDAATFLGRHVPQAGDFGVVAPGRRADLVLLDGNPLAEVTNARGILGVMVRGRWYPRHELDALLEALARASANSGLSTPPP